MDINDLIRQEIEYFYSRVKNGYDESRAIDVAFCDSIYETALKYDMCDTQRRAIISSGEAVNDTNGTVLFASTKIGTTLVAMSKKVLPNKDSDEVRGTIIHEMTHAHDFYDFAEYVGCQNHDEIFSSKYYETFFFWTEFHARAQGYKRFLEYKFRKSWKQFKKNKSLLLENIRANFNIHSNRGRLYDFMQAAGRYATYVELESGHEAHFKEDVLVGNVEEDRIDWLMEIYKFLINNKEFDSFARNIDVLYQLLNR